MGMCIWVGVGKYGVYVCIWVFKGIKGYIGIYNFKIIIYTAHQPSEGGIAGLCDIAYPEPAEEFEPPTYTHIYPYMLIYI
jgi:hypothetical protein